MISSQRSAKKWEGEQSAPGLVNYFTISTTTNISRMKHLKRTSLHHSTWIPLNTIPRRLFLTTNRMQPVHTHRIRVSTFKSTIHPRPAHRSPTLHTLSWILPYLTRLPSFHIDTLPHLTQLCPSALSLSLGG
jgi:hypothetical protein